MIARVIVLAALLAATRSAPEAADDLELGRRGVERWGRAHAVLFDSALPVQVGAAIHNFRGTLCYQGTDTACRKLLSDDDRLDRIVAAYLDRAILGKKQSVATLFALLCAAIDVESERTGWPPEEAKRYQVYELPQSMRGNVMLVTDRGIVTRPYGIERIAVLPGIHTIATARGSNERKLYELTMGEGTAELKPIQGTVSSEPDRGTDWSLVCMQEGVRSRIEGQPVWGPGRDLVVQRPAQFISAVGLSITIDAPAVECNTTCRGAIRNAALDSIAFWRAACSRCERNHLLAVRVDGEMFIDERLTLEGPAVLTPGGSGTTFFALSGRPVAQYVRLTATPPAVTARLRADATPLAKFLAGNDSGAPAMHIAVAGRPSRCGGSADVIGCAGAGMPIELNANDFVFVGNDSPLFGRGEERIRLDIVMLHEIGHWFGLPHVDPLRSVDKSRHAIMEPGYIGDGQCITRGELGLLDDAADLGWTLRLKACDGFRIQRVSAIR
jgi:hypothetical protein